MIIRVHPSISALRPSDCRTLDPQLRTADFLSAIHSKLATPSVPTLVKKLTPPKGTTQALLHSPVIRTPKCSCRPYPIMSKAKAAAKFPYLFADNPTYVESLRFRR